MELEKMKDLIEWQNNLGLTSILSWFYKLVLNFLHK